MPLLESCLQTCSIVWALFMFYVAVFAFHSSCSCCGCDCLVYVLSYTVHVKLCPVVITVLCFITTKV